MATAFNVGDRVAYQSKGEWRYGIVETNRLDAATDADGNEYVGMSIRLRDEEFPRNRVHRNIRQCAAMIPGQHV